MKPSLSYDEKSKTVIIQPSLNDGKPQVQRKFRTALIISCLVVVCVCALSIGLYFGLRDTQAVVENNVYFQELQGDVIMADVTVTKNEESFNFENAAVIYDFSTGLTVYKSNVVDEQSQGCLVESFWMNETKTPNDVKSLMQKDKVLGQTDYEEFRVTDVWLNEEALGPKSRDLCVDQEIHFIEKVDVEGVVVTDDADVDDDELPDPVTVVPQQNKRRVRRGWFRRVRIRVRVCIGYCVRNGRR